MTTPLVEDYIALHKAQFLARVRGGGRLAEEREDEFIEQFG